MKTFLIVGLTVLTLNAWSQVDTVYLRFDKGQFTSILQVPSRDSLHTKISFPFDHGRKYMFSKQKGNFVSKLIFSYWTKPLKESDNQFFYSRISNAKLKELDFVDQYWISKTDFGEVIDYFTGTDNRKRVIMLYDRTQPKGEFAYLVRVYFYYSAEE